MSVAEEVGRPLRPEQISLLGRYRDWLIGEAVAAGGVGPHEAGRIDSRHLADSLLYATFFSTPRQLCDLGSGVGLPGIPLAILFPDTHCVLVDRSDRRVHLLRRVVRVLDLANVEVRNTDLTRLDQRFPVVVTRASLPPGTMAPVVRNLLGEGGVAVAGGSWVEPPEEEGWETAEVVPVSLDRTVWFLIMRRQ